MLYQNVATLISTLATCSGAKFGSFTYKNEHGEVSKVLIIFGASTETLYRKDVEVLTQMIPDLSGIELECAQELLDSRNESLSKGIGNNSDYTLKDVYVYPQGLEAIGVRVHKENGSVQVRGLAESKTVLVKGVYPPDRRRPKTVVKDSIRAMLPSHRFRTYRLDRVGSVKLNGETLELQNLID